jgi:hypothetical protein
MLSIFRRPRKQRTLQPRPPLRLDLQDKNFIRETISDLGNLGVNLVDDLDVEKVVERACAEIEGHRYYPNEARAFRETPRPKLNLLWNLSRESYISKDKISPPYNWPVFKNARLFEDHCLDVTNQHYTFMIEEISKICAGDLKFDGYSTSNDMERAVLNLQQRGNSYRYTLRGGKNIDWTFIELMEKHLSSDSDRQFGFMGDGCHGLVVYAHKGDLAKLGSYIDYGFWMSGAN